MKNVLRYLILFISSSLFAQQDINVLLACQRKPIRVHYINGVFVSKDSDAQNTRNKIETLLNKAIDIETKTGTKRLASRHYVNPFGLLESSRVFYTHNESTGLFDDVFDELARQKEYIRDMDIDFAFNNISKNYFFDNSISRYLSVTDIQERFRRDLQNEIYLKLGDPDTAKNYFKNRSEIYTEINSSLNDNRNVILISHSQGNAFANVLYHDLFPSLNSGSPNENELVKSNYFANLRVAPPVNPTDSQNSFGSLSVIKLEQDMIVNTGIPFAENEQAPTYTFDSLFPDLWTTGFSITSLLSNFTDLILSPIEINMRVFGHGMDSMYLADDIYIKRLPADDSITQQTPADVVLEQLHELAKKFPNRCKAPLVKGDVNINVNIQKEDKISLSLELSTEMSGVVDFRGDGVDAGALNTHEGDLTLSTISLYTKENDEYNNLPEEALTLSTNADTKTMTVLVEDIKENVPFDFFGKKILYVKVGASDLFNNYGESTEFKEIDICSGVSCCKENEIFYSNQCLPEPGPCQSYNEDTLELYYSVAPSCSVKCEIRNDSLGNPAYCDLTYENVICAQPNATYGERIPLSGTITLHGYCEGLGQYSTTSITPSCSCSL